MEKTNLPAEYLRNYGNLQGSIDSEDTASPELRNDRHYLDALALDPLSQPSNMLSESENAGYYQAPV